MDNRDILSVGGVNRRVDRGSWEEVVLTVPGGARALEKAMTTLPASAEPYSADLFGCPEELPAMRDVLRQRGFCGALTEVVNAVPGWAGCSLVAAVGARVVPRQGSVSGADVHFADGQLTALGGVVPNDSQAQPARQTADLLSRMEQQLADSGLGMEHVVRTWFFNDRILDWYLPFNAARTTFFLERGIRRMPASTGVGSGNAPGASLVGKAHAIRFSEGAGSVQEAVSPLQCHAFAYGSAFSRALAVRSKGSTVLHVSGTASIGPDGKSEHPGDPKGQIDLTLRVVDALLERENFRLGDATRAVAYFADMSCVGQFLEVLARRGLGDFPLLVLPATICRSDLLFEIELDLGRPPGNAGPAGP